LGMDTEPPAPMARMARSDPGGFLRRKMSWEADGIGGRGWNPEVPRVKNTRFMESSPHVQTIEVVGIPQPNSPWSHEHRWGPWRYPSTPILGLRFSALFSGNHQHYTIHSKKKMSEDLRDSTIPVPGVQFQL
jgi:hypothetical protein